MNNLHTLVREHASLQEQIMLYRFRQGKADTVEGKQHWHNVIAECERELNDIETEMAKF